MYQLYYAPATASMVVHWLLIELKIKHKLNAIDFSKKEQKSTEYLKVNPAGVVPTLIIDGKPMSEAAAISMLICDRHAYGSLAPTIESPLRSDYMQWMFFFANSMQPAYRAWFYPTEFGDEALIKPIVQKKLESYFATINEHLADGRDYFLGDKISTLDFFMTMLIRWSRNMPTPAAEWPYINRLILKMKARPSFKEMYQREGLTDWV